MLNKTALVIALLSLFFVVSFNEYNIYLIKKNNPLNVESNNSSVVQNATIFNIDNEYYLTPVHNYMNGLGWKRSPGVSNGDFFRRVPGYSILYFSFVKTFGLNHGHLFLRYFQAIIFSLSVYCMFFIIFFFTQNRKAGIFFSLIYGILPIFSAWVYFTMTDSITSVLITFYFFFLIKSNQGGYFSKTNYFILAAFFFSYSVLTRPYVAIAGILLPVFLLDAYYLKAGKQFSFFFKKSLLILFIPLFFVGAWTYRNFHLTGEFVPLEKAFHPQSLDRMKPEYEGIFGFGKCWGEDGSHFNSYYIPFYDAALKGDTNSKYVKNTIAAFPDKILECFGYERLYNIIRTHQLTILEQKPFFDSVVAMPAAYLASQLKVLGMYNELIQEYKIKHWFKYWFVTPIIYLQRMVFNSFTANLMIFQKEYRHNIIFNLIRYFLLLVHIGMYLCLFFNLFNLKNNLLKISIVYTPLLFIIFFTIIHREIQQHYMMPVISLMFLNYPVVIKNSFFAKKKIKTLNNIS